MESDNVLILTVQKGKYTPYCYKGKAYKRNDASTIEVSQIEYKNLVLRIVSGSPSGFLTHSLRWNFFPEVKDIQMRPCCGAMRTRFRGSIS